ncbi:MAG TPA: SH3 domain-containing protein [Euzebyales bacterium]|nr:SH3 domain-containing protein [Euzebyales bacterium]
MTARTPTRELPHPAHEPTEQQPPRSRWPAVAAGAIGMLIIAVIAAVVWFLARQEPLDVGPAPQDDPAAEPQQPEAPAEEPQRPGDDAQRPGQPDEPGPVVVYGTELRANWDVTGVSADDRLNVRTGPGVHNAVMATLAADTVELESTGRIARVDGALWREIVVPGDGTGWVNAGYLAETSPVLLDDGRHAAYLHWVDVAASTSRST